MGQLVTPIRQRKGPPSAVCRAALVWKSQCVGGYSYSPTQDCHSGIEKERAAGTGGPSCS